MLGQRMYCILYASIIIGIIIYCHANLHTVWLLHVYFQIQTCSHLNPHIYQGGLPIQLHKGTRVYSPNWQGELGKELELRRIGLHVRKGPTGRGGSGKGGVNNYLSMCKTLPLITEHIINQ